jgi:glutamyl-tRNA synthetase
MTVLLRFAPSPTGFLHIGNARVALWNYLYARKCGGGMILRIDDTDVERSTPAFAAAIEEDLSWLSIRWTRIERQSDRIGRYNEALADLKARGLVYPAYETADELDRKRKRQQARGLPPVYDRSALKLTDAERAAFEAEGRKPHWRFKLSGQPAGWMDGVRGQSRIETASMSDPVLVRGDGAYLYTFASVVDDADMGITDVLRGEDHVANTGVQIEIFKALGFAPPRFHHHNLIVAANGEEMSKRKGTLSIRSFREAGVEPEAVAAIATLTGTSQAVHAIQSLEDLLPAIEMSHFSRALTKFDPVDVPALSARILHERPVGAVQAELAAAGVPADKAEAFWLAIRGNLAKRADIPFWTDLVFGQQAGKIDEPDFMLQAEAALPSGALTGDSWELWTTAIKAATGRKGKALFMPLRLALTGLEHGPELKGLLPLMGREKLLARLRGQSG